MTGIFVNSGESCAAVLIVDGGYFWMDNFRQSLFTSNLYSPVVIQTDRKTVSKTFERFLSAILKTRLSSKDNQLVYRGPNSAEVEFHTTTPE